MVVSDFIDNLKKPYSMEDFIVKYEVKTNFLKYVKVTSIINWRDFPETREPKPRNSFKKTNQSNSGALSCKDHFIYTTLHLKIVILNIPNLELPIADFLLMISFSNWELSHLTNVHSAKNPLIVLITCYYTVQSLRICRW